MFSGSIPALVTPFRDGGFAEPTFRAFVDWQIAQGSSGLVPCGTTGESATMSIAEHDRVVAVCIEQAAGRVPVIAGCGSNDTAVALEHMRSAQKAGADATVEIERQALIAGLDAAPGGGPCKANLHRQVEHQGQVGAEVADGKSVELCDQAPVDAVAVALIGQRRIGETVADHPGALL